MRNATLQKGKLLSFALVLLVCAGLFPAADVSGFTLTVKDKSGSAVTAYRWLLEEDNTLQTAPGITTNYSISTAIHKSHAPVVARGQNNTTITVPDLAKSYYISVLPDAGYSNSGAMVAPGQSAVTVLVTPHPKPTAQISVLVFNDNNPINNAPDRPAEAGLPGFAITIDDAIGGGPVSQDAFGNPLGTTYRMNNGQFDVDADGNPIPDLVGNSTIITDANGEALIKYLAPGKYGVTVTPPGNPDPAKPWTHWIQTATIEGTRVIDAWVQANEPQRFVEGFGTGFQHVSFGFVKQDATAWWDPGSNTYQNLGSSSIAGRVVYNHFSKPPNLNGFFPGAPVPECWVGLNDPVTQQGLMIVPCDADSNFTLSNIPGGNYQLVTWDVPLIALFGFNTAVVANGQALDLGNVLSFKWFGELQGKVFFDNNENGFPDAGEQGIPGQAVIIRFRDGSVYQSTATDATGSYELGAVFPFFKWLVTEVDFARFKATGMTAAADNGGQIPADNGWITPSRGKLNPQPQAAVNPNTGNNLSRTETGPVLTQAMHLFLGQTNVIDWGKKAYPAGENGGISGIVFYDTTRAEDDPRFGGGEPWQPGVPRAQVNLYADANSDGIIDDQNGDGVVLADADNYPLGWKDGNARGPEDIDRNGNNIFDPGDAINIAATDSWDDNNPTNCIQTLPIINGQPTQECFDNFGTWNQVRDGLFDGGYAFTSYFPGGIASGSTEVDGLPSGRYIVEAVPPLGYEIVKSQDKNVDFGDQYTPSLLALPPVCVGDAYTVPAELSLFPGEPANLAGEVLNNCDRKQVEVASGRNAAADFFTFTEVPKTSRAVGFINNDLAAEFDTTSPVFGEKSSPKWLPVSFQDYEGNEVARVYTDEYGSYNALLPSTYSVQIPHPSGVSPNMLTAFLNHPWMPDPNNPNGPRIKDPFYDPNYSQMAWTFQYLPGTSSYLDTPIVPVGAFVGTPNLTVDVEPANGIPVIYSVNGPQGGPIVCNDGQQITLIAVGTIQVPNPDYNNLPGNTAPRLITRDFGFGPATGQRRVTVGGIPLTIQTWSNLSITATVPVGVSTGQLLVTRGDNGRTSETGITLHVGGCNSVIRVANGQSIQAAIDSAADGSLILVGPGVYNEAVIVWKNVRLQGYGPEVTKVYPYPEPLSKLDAWHAKIAALVTNGDIPNPNPNIPLNNRPLAAVEMPGFFVTVEDGVFSQGSPGLIDGFGINGAISGGGIQVWDFARYLQISNNRINGNQGTRGGGITVGSPGVVSANDHVAIKYNQILKNSGVDSAGGTAIYSGADAYQINNNRIIGNFSRTHGGGIGHYGLSDGGIIAYNKILFNEIFFGKGTLGDGAGIFVGGQPEPAPPGANPPPLSAGTGTVTINGNLIQGNLTGSSNGGGIRALGINGQDVNTLPEANWYRLNIFNNMLVNNVTALAGGGIALQDALKTNVINNTIANNYSTATAAAAFPPGNLQTSSPQGAGIVSSIHSAQLQAEVGAGFSDPVLQDNIIWHNRSFTWDGSLNNGTGGLIPSGFRDLLVVGAAGALNPRNCILSSTAGYHSSNRAQNPLFAREYLNDLIFGVVVDEGGNFISARFTPLTADAGDYHITASSPAISLAAGTFIGTFPALGRDYDNEIRPQGGQADSGADERPGAVTSPNPPGNFTVTRISSSTIRAAWTVGQNAVTYRLERRIRVAGIALAWTVLSSAIPAATTVFNDASVAPVNPLNRYQYRIRSENGALVSTWVTSGFIQ